MIAMISTRGDSRIVSVCHGLLMSVCELYTSAFKRNSHCHWGSGHKSLQRRYKGTSAPTWMRHLVSHSIQLQLKMAEMNTGVLKFVLIAIFLLGCFLLKSENNNFHRSDSDVINPKDKEEHCQPKTRIAFAKTHKTGSSTIQVGSTWWYLNPLH